VTCGHAISLRHGDIFPVHSWGDELDSPVAGTQHAARLAGMPYWTDAAILGRAGIPTVVFGPGGDGYHGLEEYVVADEVIARRDALAALVHDFCI
jgi:acetylornithine deacetylase/succinyl-diaminopimelate desuccinylase-like protein